MNKTAVMHRFYTALASVIAAAQQGDGGVDQKYAISAMAWNTLRTHIPDWDKFVNEHTEQHPYSKLFKHKDEMFVAEVQFPGELNANPTATIAFFGQPSFRVWIPLAAAVDGLSGHEAHSPQDTLVSQPPAKPKVRLGFKKLDPAAKLPCYAHEGDAGMDVFALNDVTLEYGVPTIVKTGLAAEIPDGYEIQVRPRSGLAAKGVTVWNSPGTIDSKYRGEIGVILMFVKWQDGPLSEDRTCLQRIAVKEYQIKKGDKIAQLVLAPVTFANPVEVEELSTTERGAGGFGSTGR